MKSKLIPAIFLSFIALAAHAQDKPSSADFQRNFDDLIKICVAHPEFNPSSIDNFDKSKAPIFQKDFYEKSSYFYSQEGMDFLTKKRETANDQTTVQCIDKIFSTLPG